MTKLVLCLVLLNLTLACGKGFHEEKAQKAKPRNNQEDDSYTVNQDYLTLVNEYRINRQLRPLSNNSYIESIARDHSKGMALQSRAFGHLGLSQRCRKIKERVGAHKRCAEIIATGPNTPRAVLRRWLSSFDHRATIEQEKFTMTGLGMYRDEKGVAYWTQIFVDL